MGEGIGHVVFLRGIGMVSRADKGIKFWFITSRIVCIFIAIFSLSIFTSLYLTYFSSVDKLYKKLFIHTLTSYLIVLQYTFHF